MTSSFISLRTSTATSDHSEELPSCTTAPDCSCVGMVDLSQYALRLRTHSTLAVPRRVYGSTYRETRSTQLRPRLGALHRPSPGCTNSSCISTIPPAWMRREWPRH